MEFPDPAVTAGAIYIHACVRVARLVDSEWIEQAKVGGTIFYATNCSPSVECFEKLLCSEREEGQVVGFARCFCLGIYRINIVMKYICDAVAGGIFVTKSMTVSW